MALTARRLEVRPDGGDGFGADDVVAIAPAAWERWNTGAVWCALEDLTSHRRVLRVAIVPPDGVVQDGDEQRVLVPSTAAAAWFWTASGLYSAQPRPETELDVRGLAAAVETWLDGGSPDAPPAPALRLRMGHGEELMRDEILLELETGWLRGRRYELEDEPTVILDDFSMRDLLLDLSALLTLTLLGE
jgi:hypothetical protein